MQLFERLMDLLLLTAADERLLRVVVGVGKQLFQPFKGNRRMAFLLPVEGIGEVPYQNDEICFDFVTV